MNSKHYFLIIVIKFVYVSARILGLRPYDYSIKTGQITNSKLNTFLAVSVCIICSYLYQISVGEYMKLLKPSFKQTMLTVQSTYAIFYTNITVFLGIYIFQNIFKPNLLKLLRNGQKFHKKTKYIFKNSKIKYKKSLIIFCIKSIYIKLMVIVVTIFCLKEGSGPGIFVIFITLPAVVIFSVSNLFYGSVIGIKYYFEALNSKIEKILDKINFIKKRGNFTLYEKSKIHCDLSDQIDEITVLHSELSYISREFADIFHIQILLIFVNTFICVILQVMIFSINIRNGGKFN